MSINRNISTLPDTKRTFESLVNNFAQISGIFLSKQTFKFLGVDKFTDYDVWRQDLDDGNITPLHHVKEIEPIDEETTYLESLQDYSYKGRPGRYRHKIRYDWNLDLHQIVEGITENDLYVFYWDKNKNIYGVDNGDGTISGFKTNRIILEKILLQIGSNPAFSVLDIEWKDSDQLNVNGIVKQVTWNPEDIDRLFASITVEYIDSATLNFSASYRGNTIDDISSNEVTVTDDQNGQLTFSLFNYNGGVYQLSGFSDDLTNGKLSVLSSLYLGCTSYTVQISVSVAVNYDFEDSVNYEFEDAVNFEFET